MKQFITLVTCMLLSLSLVAQKNVDLKFTGSTLWKVSGKGLVKPSYIFGTHHLSNNSIVDKLTGFEEAFAQAEIIAGEIDLKNKEELIQQVQLAVLIKEGEKGYKDLLSDEELEELNGNLLTHLGIPLSAVMAIKPVLLQTLIAAKLMKDVDPNFNPDTHISIDEYLQTLGKEKGKEIRGLEGVDDQIKALFSAPIEKQLADLRCGLNEMELGKELFMKLNEYYLKGDLNALYNLTYGEDPTVAKSACPTTEEEKYAMLEKRNNHWLKQLPQLFENNSVFVAVGALHLAGEEGLLYQLDKMGYTVEAAK